MLDPDILAHYELGLEETRLVPDGRPRLEYLRTLELLDRLLPPPPARILDVGGGTGVYAVPLCERGYSVHLVDPVPLHVERAGEIARARGLTQLTVGLGDARDLGEHPDDFGAVLLLGPLYHLIDADDRLRALAEAIRVTEPGGVVIAVGISRYASLLDGLKQRSLGDPAFGRIVEQDLRDGHHRNPDVGTRPEHFTTAYFHLPAELEREAEVAGLLDVRLFAVEGPAWMFEDPDDLDNQLDAARRTESAPDLMGATSHILVAGITAS